MCHWVTLKIHLIFKNIFSKFYLNCVFFLSINITHFNILHLLQEPVADRLQRLLWPFVEPVNGRAVHHCRKLPAANPEFVSNRRETQRHLETHSVIEMSAKSAVTNEVDIWRASSQTAWMFKVWLFTQQPNTD